MNPPLPRLPAALTAAAQRIKVTAREAGQRCVDDLGVAALSSANTSEREDLLAAQFELNRKQSALAMAFNERFDDSLAAEMRRREGSTRINTRSSSWQSLTLVDDREVEIQVSAERFALTLQRDCEWELRELDALMHGLLHDSHSEIEARNPLRPEVLGKAMVAACDAVSDKPSVRKVMAEQMAKTLASVMSTLYGTIVAELKAAGVKPPEMSVRSVQGPGNEQGHAANTGYDTLGRPIGVDAPDTGAGRLTGGAGAGGGGGGGGSGPTTRSGGPSTRSGPSTGSGGPSSTATIGQVDGEVMNLIRRLAMLGNIAVDTQMDTAQSGRSSAVG
ncbi:MAG TPA: DUF1631 family protein, partial [Burkholderiaceae bacterium]